MNNNPFNPFPVLKTDRLILRNVEKTDLQDIFDYASDLNLTTYLTWRAHQTLADTEGFIEFILASNERHMGATWVIVWKENNRVIGTIDLSWNQKHYSAELAYALSRKYWRKGIGTEAVQEIVRFGFEEVKLERIHARCHPKNEASYKLMEKTGMIYEGTLRKSMRRKGKQEDIKIYSILKSEFEG
ncbi:alanine acetyltransferase [Oceanobacillus oncorhynchi subsp. incaldanensis]|uniref:GNAT family N-acetyltransferase n=1 Tax=Oceanobacillus aidingensis TaxID=645964 RepID=A0ABV9JWQ6_9BACI|nr:GNAT family protein [Oceanobacillus oncorhynchi]MDM8101973.1 GNAT family protein [Oceanobacillus oncorhynchi]GIO18009.1 alanine acetyltransferase [Oceanobacillus oncorhynchi subsp. incaldanensis]